MKINFRRAALTVLSAAGLSVACCTTVDAAPAAPSIAIKFASEVTDGAGGDGNSQVNGAAGVLNTVTWNNLTGANSAAPALLTADVAGAPTATAATAVWTSAGTWSSTGLGEENNTAAHGDNRDLMAGYLDTGAVGGVPVSITVANLPPVAGFPFFDVYVYIQGGVNGRGGNYTIGGTTLDHVGDAAFGGTFVQDTVDPGTTAGSNYIVFRGLSGSGFTLNTLPLIGDPARAPVNGIEIVASPVPEPSTLALLGLGVITVGGIAWRRRRES
jgi:PEP-CTERM motif-containing protein